MKEKGTKGKKEASQRIKGLVNRRKTISIIAIAIICLIAVALYMVAVVTDINEKQMATQNLEQSSGKTNETSQNGKEENKRNDKQPTNHEAKPKALVDDEKMTVWHDARGEQVPVPRGYVGSSVTARTGTDGKMITAENEIDTGFVIYEGEEPVTNANVETAQKERNQYVWVPVPNPSEMYGIDANRKEMGKAL